MQNEPSERNFPRIPYPAGDIQVNFCKNPTCRNFGIPASTDLQPRGRHAMLMGRDDYSISGIKSKSAGIKCSVCNEVSTVKSNRSIVEEFDRISAYLKIKKVDPSCPNKECQNHTIGISSEKGHYQKFGKTAPGSLRYRCKSCMKTFTVAATSTLRHKKPHKNIQVFTQLVNQSSFKRTCKIVKIKMPTLFGKIDFIHKQCMAFVANRERRLINGDIPMERLYVSVDRQAYSVNWANTRDKRNIILWAIGSADNTSSYIFGMNLNYDASMDKVAVERDANAYHDYNTPAAFRKYARVWLSKDYMDARIRSASQPKPNTKSPLHENIVAAYTDVENQMETDVAEPQDATTRLPAKGMQVHAEYTAYAHFYLLKKLLKHVKKVRFFIDQDLNLRQACLSAFNQEIRDKMCDLFYVRITHDMPVHLRYNAISQMNQELYRLSEKYHIPETHWGIEEDDIPKIDLKLELIKEKMREMVPIGKWNDRWLIHPIANMSEPEKAVCHLTNSGQYEENRMAKIYSHASLHGIDRFFMQVRRRVRLLERPLASHGNSKQKWFLYSAYNPERMVKLLDIYRVYYNYCEASELDGKTPAMRLGLANGEIDMETILYYK